MKTITTSKKLFMAGFALVILTNIIILSAVALNRSTEQKREILLTERELGMPYRSHKENSGLSLSLVWRTLDENQANSRFYAYRRSSPSWFDIQKLRELGFNITDDHLEADSDTTHYKEPVPKEVFIVLEYEGELYEASLKRAQRHLEKEEELLRLSSENKKLRENVKEAQNRLKQERTTASRLFAIDAGNNPEALRKKYDDQAQFIITKGLVKPKYHYKNKKVMGHIQSLSISSIYVPLKYRQLLDIGSEKSLGKDDPHYKVSLAYGSRYEPWIVTLQLQ